MPELQLPGVCLPPTARSELELSHFDIETDFENFQKRQSTYPNSHVRIEWDTYNPSDKQSYIDAIKCLMRAPTSSRFPGSQNRYEDLVVLHQRSMPRVHGNALFCRGTGTCSGLSKPSYVANAHSRAHYRGGMRVGDLDDSHN